MKNVLILLWLIFIGYAGDFALSQSDNFYLNAHKQFLLNNGILTASNLPKMEPENTYKVKISPLNSSPLYLDNIILKYQLTYYKKSLIQNQFFILSERSSRSSVAKEFMIMLFICLTKSQGFVLC